MQKASRNRRKKIKQVQSGIALSGLASDKEAPVESFLTSRTARVLLAGAGFLADAYDLFVINLVLRLLKDEYPQYAASGNLHYLEGSVASAALVGSMIGQIVAGSLADLLGRKKIFICTAALIIIGSLGSACSIDTPLLTIYGQICCWRFFLGTGVGGEYPLAATVTSESSSAGKRGSLMSAVFAMQGVGALVSGIVVISCLLCGYSTAFTWRFALAFGAVPPLLAFPYRMRMHETETFERVRQERLAADIRSGMTENPIAHETDSLLNPTSAAGAGISSAFGGANYGTDSEFVRLQDGRMFYHEIAIEKPIQTSARWQEILHAFRFYRFHLLGTALAWFLLDVDFYANGLFNHEVTGIILSKTDADGIMTPSTAIQDATNSIIISLISIPGYLLSVLYIDRVGRKNLQLLGFGAMGLLFLTCAVGFDAMLGEDSNWMGRWGFMVIYSLTFLFSNFGPNTTTFVIPGEIYPTEVRATCHGLSAASGKLGAATGAYFFPLLLGPQGALNPTPQGMKNAMFMCSFVAFLGVLVTWFLTPNYDSQKLEDEVYLALDFACLRPPEDVMAAYGSKNALSAMNSTNDMMMQVVHSAHDYGLESVSGGGGGGGSGESGSAKV